MGKRQRKIEAIQKYIKNAAGNWSAYYYGKIPDLLIKNACNAYAGAVQKNDVLGLIDITISGNGKKGMLFTERKLYYNNGMLGSSGSVSYQYISDMGRIPEEVLDSYYNREALKELLFMLSDIEAESFQDVMNGINETMDSFDQGVQSVAEVVDKGLDLLGSFLSFFDSGDSSDDDEY